MSRISLYTKRKFGKALGELAQELTKVVIVKDEKTYKKLISQLSGVYLNTFDKVQESALKEVIDYMVGIGEDSFTKSDAKEIKKLLQEKFGAKLTELVEKSVLELHNKVYKFGINEVARSADLKLSYAIKDKEAAAILAKQNMFWIGDYYDKNLSKDFDEVLSGYFDSGKTIEDIAKDFELKFEGVVEKGKNYYKQLAHHSVNRVRNLGAITGFEKAQIIKYEVFNPMDDTTSDICEEMNGRVFLVSKAIEFRDAILNMEHPEEIKQIAAWRSAEDIKDVKTEDLPAGMEAPPYHFGECRSQIIAHFE